MPSSLVPRFLTPDVLRAWRLPLPDPDGDKEERGRVLVVAGAPELPGAALLAGLAALRVGAGKLCVATAQPVAVGLGLALPEARVIGLPALPSGGLAPDSIEHLKSLGHYDAVLVGPGLQDEQATRLLVRSLLALWPQTPFVLDALAMNAALDVERFSQPVALTPHAGEMAHLRGLGKEAVLAEPASAALEAAQRWGSVVALKGSTTYIASPSGPLWRHDGGSIGLATSGSGDALAGALAGLAARGAHLEQACAWAVSLHGMAGESLGRRVGPLGFLAREIPAELPALLQSLQG